MKEMDVKATGRQDDVDSPPPPRNENVDVAGRYREPAEQPGNHQTIQRR